ncbi:unnamed protein product [Didymodactylos carnosus]|uniref:Uncharacterized protein n=1 Tax=Didymodactylos carnosus TaxID=1234261 RepID=A0A815UMV5_9BILA|nr:unnamed protein product [Didymodactylos carnosus]CAF1518297.1 unnamed protein product [Didymodactylos carnosus]CAF4172727.1 unnamed protein product [Didymodactylos carnosus]CAF4377956.1 unnamed protein product [Didymodactylos carnosus]
MVKSMLRSRTYLMRTKTISFELARCCCGDVTTNYWLCVDLSVRSVFIEDEMETTPVAPIVSTTSRSTVGTCG